jgi:hypothetical protein
MLTLKTVDARLGNEHLSKDLKLHGEEITKLG